MSIEEQRQALIAAMPFLEGMALDDENVGVLWALYNGSGLLSPCEVTAALVRNS